MKKLGLLLAGLIIIASIIAAGVKLSSPKTAWLKFEDAMVSFEYPASLTPASLTEEDKKTNTVFRATEKDPKDPDISVALSYEDDLKLLSNLLHRDILDILLDNSARVLPTEYPNYKELSRKIISSSSPKKAEIKFSYQQESQEAITQRFYLLVSTDENRAYYLTAQTKQADTDKLDKAILNRLFNSLKLK